MGLEDDMAEDGATTTTPIGAIGSNGTSTTNGVQPQPGRSRRMREAKRAAAESMPQEITTIAASQPVRANGVQPQPGRSRRAREAHRAATGGVSAGANEPVADLAPVAAVADGGSVVADRTDLASTAVGRFEGGDLSVSMGAVGAARAERVSVDKGAIGAAMADRVEVSRGYARSILARNVQLDRAAARVVVAAEVNAQRSAVLFLVARRVSGDVKVLLDWRGAIAFGAVAGVLAGLLRRGRNGSKRS
jgi:hypothetical protein